MSRQSSKASSREAREHTTSAGHVVRRGAKGIHGRSKRLVHPELPAQHEHDLLPVREVFDIEQGFAQDDHVLECACRATSRGLVAHVPRILRKNTPFFVSSPRGTGGMNVLSTRTCSW